MSPQLRKVLSHILPTPKFFKVAFIFSQICLLSCSTPKEESPHTRSYNQMAQAFANDGLYAECLTSLESALKDEPTNPQSLFLKGLCLMGRESFAESESILKPLCEKEKSADCYNALAALYLKTERYEKCLVSSSQALAIQTYSFFENALSHRALCSLKLGDFATAVKSAEAAKKKNPARCDLRYTLVRIHLQRGAIDAAFLELDSLLTQCPAEVNTHFWLAYAHFKKGNKESALKRYHYIVSQFKRGELVEESKSNLELLENHVPIPEPKL